MVLTTVKAIVIRERPVGENDKFIDILTDKLGVVEVLVKGAKKITGKNTSATQLFAYSTFCLQKRNKHYYINSSEPIKIFYGIRENLDSLSLACYFADVIAYVIQYGECCENVQRLFLNCMHYLSNGERDARLIKSIFEMRLLCELGMMPNMVACSECSVYEDTLMFLMLNEGKIYCQNCFKTVSKELYVEISISVIHAIRHIVFSDFKQLFNFRLSEKSMQMLLTATEKYLLAQLGRTFKTLKFYKSLKISIENEQN